MHKDLDAYPAQYKEPRIRDAAWKAEGPEEIV
jgi:hypothetical protein